MNKTTKEKEAVLNVFGGLFGPLMRVAFEYGITAGEIAGVVRRAYIQALEARLKEQRRPTIDARLVAVAGDAGCHACHTQFTCTERCPKKLKPTAAIAGLKRSVLSAALKGEI